MCDRQRFSPTVISTGGPAPPGWNGEISPGTRGAPDHGPNPVQRRLRAGPSTALRSAQDDKGNEGNNHSNAATGGFTLIELLVVISIVVLLMALLFPALSRARKQARAVVCQSRQRGWSLLFAAYQSENDGRFPDQSYSVWDARTGQRGSVPFFWPLQMEFYSGSDLRGTLVCPSATKPVPPDAWRTRGMGVAAGTTFLAWRLRASVLNDIEVALMAHSEYIGSYAMNWHLYDYDQLRRAKIRPTAIPALLDSRGCYSGLQDAASDEPPPYEDYELGGSPPSYSAEVAIDRHQGGINTLFGDGAIRKVGVKELWTLEWCEESETAGPWTKAGGVQPGDWPHWMRRFKEY